MSAEADAEIGERPRTPRATHGAGTGPAAETEAASARERLELALLAGGLGDWSWDARTDLVTLGDQAARIFDLPFGEPLTWSDMRLLLREDDRERARVAVEQSIAERNDYRIEYRIAHRELGERWIAARGRGVYDASGTATGMVGVVQDITDRKLAEEALAEETRTLELLLKSGRTLGATLELDELLQRITDDATALCGAAFGAFFYNTTDENGETYQLYTLSGAPREAFARFGHPRATPLFGPTFHGEGPTRIADVLLDARYGQWAPHHGMPAGHLPVRSYLAMPVRSRSGATLGGLFFGHPDPGVFTERSERLVVGIAAQAGVALDNAALYREAQRASAEREQLLAAERAARAESDRTSRLKDEFLATLSHELRTPLNAILGWAQVLSRRPAAPDDSSRGLDAIMRNARIQVQLVDDLLDMSRIIAGKVRLDVQLLEPAGVVEAALDAIRPTAEAKQLRLYPVIDPRAGPVSGDPNRLQQVVWNLLTNAVKFTPKGGRVDVVVRRVDSRVEIVVSDNGIGIAPEFLPHVFERFRQADASTTRTHGGLGLGLSIVRSLVEMQAGTIHAESEGPGRGARFVVALPVAPSRGAHRPDLRAQAPAGFDASAFDLHGIVVLLVDDDAEARGVVEALLRQCHAEVVTADSGKRALAILDERVPDVIVSDIGMPNLDGYEFIRAVRKRSPEAGGRVPAIALTAYARSEDRTRALLAGFAMHLSKPADAHELVATIMATTRNR